MLTEKKHTTIDRYLLPPVFYSKTADADKNDLILPGGYFAVKSGLFSF